MRAKLGVLAVGLVALGALVAPANTKTAEARSSAAPAPPSRAAQSPTAVASVSVAAGAEAAPEPAASPAAASVEIVTPPPADLRLENPKLRRMQKHEITKGMLELSASVVRRHYAKPVGTQIELEVAGKRVIARIERHFHPEGGAVKPWGFHPGVSLFVAR
jgi:hypothetical protein